MGNAPIQHFPWRGVSQLGAGILSQRTQGPQQQRRGLIFGQRWRTVGLAEFVAIGLGNQRDVQVTRLPQAKQLLQVELAWRGVEQVGAAHDVGDTLPGIVQHHRQLIGVEPVAAANHEITDIPAQMLMEFTLHPVDEVVVQYGDTHADGGVFGAVPGIAAESRINAVIRLQLLARARARVGQAVIEQAIEYFGVGIVAVTLANHFAIPLETIAFQRLEDRGLGAGFFTGRVKVFHAHQPTAAH
ncbi:hypothetical protein D3C87_1304280 [compost metagenome]